MVYTVPVDGDRQIIKVKKPVIQMQAHRIGYSSLDGKFRPMVMGKESISWGIQFSYPQIYEDSGKVVKVNESDQFPNTARFKKMQRWMRRHTIPTPFLADGKRVNVPMRLGKQCLPWINTHPQLVEKNIGVSTASCAQ